MRRLLTALTVVSLTIVNMVMYGLVLLLTRMQTSFWIWGIVRWGVSPGERVGFRQACWQTVQVLPCAMCEKFDCTCVVQADIPVRPLTEEECREMSKVQSV